MEKRTDIIQLKAPTKWEILKTKSKGIKQYLKGTFVKGTMVTGASKMPEIQTSKFDDPVFLNKHQRRRKRLNKLKYESRRKNRSGL
jgi:hypothetical protein